MRITKFFSAHDWDEFVAKRPLGWFWHLRSWVDYQVAYAPGSTDCSRVVVDDDDELLGVAPMVRAVDGRLSYGGGPHPFPLAKTRAAYDMLVDEIAKRGGAVLADHAFIKGTGSPIITARVGPVSSGFSYHRVIDLKALDWAKVRKSYHSLITGALRKYTITTHVGEEALERGEEGKGSPFARYQFCHMNIAAKPRPDATYRAQARWLEEGRALVTVASEGRLVLGAQYWFLYRGSAYYGSSAAVVRDGVSHAMVWMTLQALADRGYGQADMGSQGGETEKDRGIATFKAGFGGEDVPVRIAEVKT